MKIITRKSKKSIDNNVHFRWLKICLGFINILVLFFLEKGKGVIHQLVHFSLTTLNSIGFPYSDPLLNFSFKKR